jgi:hypothetical protein
VFPVRYEMSFINIIEEINLILSPSSVGADFECLKVTN